jgi:thiamine-phosphate pyrophosphorylase
MKSKLSPVASHVSRVIDANINRAVEGIRVVEEITRFVLEDKKLTEQLKKLRSKIRRLTGFEERDTKGDVGRELYTESEGRRAGLLDVFLANMKRAQEALRVLEEFSKMADRRFGAICKAVRFKLYDLEKKIYFPLSRKVKLDFKIYLVTDPKYGHLNCVKKAIKSGIKIVQLRDKTATKNQLVKWGKQIRLLAKKAGLTFIVNDSIEIAKAIKADGVHLGQEDLKRRSINSVRKILGQDKLIGISVANLAQAKKAERGAADYLGAGPVFATPNKKDQRPIGLKALGTIIKGVKIPVVAIGGIKESNISQVLKSGCPKVAVISEISNLNGLSKQLGNR